MSLRKYQFQKFTSFNSRSVDRIVSITKNNTISISSGFAEANKIDECNFAVLYYDKKLNSIAIKFTNDKNEQAKFALTRAHVGKGASIIAHSFFKKNNISASSYAGRKYLPQKLNARSDLGLDERGSLYVFDLDEGVGGDSE